MGKAFEILRVPSSVLGAERSEEERLSKRECRLQERTTSGE